MYDASSFVPEVIAHFADASPEIATPGQAGGKEAVVGPRDPNESTYADKGPCPHSRSGPDRAILLG